MYRQRRWVYCVVCQLCNQQSSFCEVLVSPAILVRVNLSDYTLDMAVWCCGPALVHALPPNKDQVRPQKVKPVDTCEDVSLILMVHLFIFGPLSHRPLLGAPLIVLSRTAVLFQRKSFTMAAHWTSGKYPSGRAQHSWCSCFAL